VHETAVRAHAAWVSTQSPCGHLAPRSNEGAASNPASNPTTMAARRTTLFGLTAVICRVKCGCDRAQPGPRTRYNSKLADRTHPKCCREASGYRDVLKPVFSPSNPPTPTPKRRHFLTVWTAASMLSQHVRFRPSPLFCNADAACAALRRVAHGGELFRCRYDEIVRRTCCCPQSTAPETTDCSIRGPASDCCDVSTIGVDASPTGSERVTPVVSSIVWRLPGQELAILDLRPFGAASRRDVQDTSPPILRLTCSLQI